MDSDKKFASELLGRLKEENTAVISSVSKDGKPHSAIINFVLKDRHLYFVTRRSSQKCRNIRGNKRVSLLISNLQELPTSAQIEGHAVVVADETEKDDIINTFSSFWSTFSYLPPVFSLPGKGFVLVKVKIKKLQWLQCGVSAKDTLIGHSKV